MSVIEFQFNQLVIGSVDLKAETATAGSMASTPNTAMGVFVIWVSMIFPTISVSGVNHVFAIYQWRRLRA